MGAAELRDVRAAPGWIDIHLTDAGSTNGVLYVISQVPLDVECTDGIGEASVSAAGSAVWKVTLKGRKRGAVQRIRLRAMGASS